VIFQVLTAASMKIPAVWNTALCSLVEVDRRFRGAYCRPSSLIKAVALMDAVRMSEMSVYFNETTRALYPRRMSVIFKEGKNFGSCGVSC
jgi:hypothetical protein